MIMALYSSPPEPRPFSADKPTILTSWWITIFCAFVILLRLLGRFVRVEKLFKEDKVAAAVLIPLFLRMAIVHPALVFGTNNVLINHELSSEARLEDLRHRAIGSGLILASRVAYASTLWTLKLVTLEFFNRLVGASGKKKYARLLLFCRIVLAATFVAFVISNLAECTPFKHYWQVSPDPGPKCRQAYANLLTGTACNIFTDLMLIIFPIPIVLQSRLSRGQKALLIGLFGLHLPTVIIAVYRIPHILEENGYQATRSMWASVEILAATFATNALAIGTFVRDKGAKKKKFRYAPPPESFIRDRRESRTTNKRVSWDEDEGDDAFGSNHSQDKGLGDHISLSSRADTRNVESPETLKGTTTGSTSVGENERSMRSASMDSLIPREMSPKTPLSRAPSRFNHPSSPVSADAGTHVIKTTTIEMTVSSAAGPEGYENEINGLKLTPISGVVTANARGRSRGSSVVVSQMKTLPS
ncbi:hypothetical protein QBC38DRAFT_195059 [Podospora fimiseda]|uniref:Rhodopsin domain-containing protein n=1 Tax=Podospora fimiseda TaxID=252190 RepID=A0AAN7BPS1_9PEZI|nr:hypothetical protein QBC38DRAFT_195059 [Podospora fimiseda]